jgi:hypothetical protein
MSQDDLFLENAAKTLTPSQVEKFKAALLSPDRENQVIKAGAPGQTRARLRIHDPQSGVTAEINHQYQIVNYSDPSPSARPPIMPLNEASFSHAGPQRLAEGRKSVLQPAKRFLELEYKTPPTLAAKKPANFDSLGMRDSRSNQPISWEGLNKALATRPFLRPSCLSCA